MTETDILRLFFMAIWTFFLWAVFGSMLLQWTQKQFLLAYVITLAAIATTYPIFFCR